METTPNYGLNNDDEMRLLFQASVGEYMDRLREFRLPEIHTMVDGASEYGLCHRGELIKSYYRAKGLVRNYCAGDGCDEDLESALALLDQCRDVFSRTNGHPPNIRALVLVELNASNVHKLLGNAEESVQARSAAESHLKGIIVEETENLRAKYAHAETDILECHYKR